MAAHDLSLPFGVLGLLLLQNIISVETNVKDFLKAVSEATDADKLRQDLFDNKKMSQALDTCLDVNEASMLSEIVFQRLSDLHKACLL